MDRRFLILGASGAALVVTLAALFKDQLGLSFPVFSDAPPRSALPGEPCATSTEGATYAYSNASNVDYTMPDYETARPTDTYWQGLVERLRGLNPLIVTGGDGLSSEELRFVRDKLVGAVVVHSDDRMIVGPDGQCARPVAALITGADPRYPGEQVMHEFPRMQNARQELYDFYMGHETGHLLDRVLNLQAQFNELPLAQRALLYREMEEFQKFLEQTGRPVNGTRSGPEGIADVLSYLLREPDLVRSRAPGMYQFLVSRINAPGSPVANLITFR